MRTAFVFSVLVLAAGVAVPAAAQEPAPAGVEWRLTPAVVRQGGVFGDDDPERSGAKLGVTLGGQARFQPQRFAGFVFEATLLPVSIRNPHFDESLQSLQAQIGVELGRRFYVRPSLGAALHLWSGAFAEGARVGPAAALGIGLRPKPGRGVTVWPELVARTSAEIGAAAWAVGVQVAIAKSR
jgi:hypothetical protein